MAYHNNPYNFVPLHDKVFSRYSAPEELPSHGTIQNGLLSGMIHCTITAETKLTVSDGDKGFFRNAHGDYVIPGSTLKGLVRQNMQILGFGAMRPGLEFNDDSILYRLVAPKKDHPKFSLGRSYINALGADHKEAPNFIPEHVESGYLVQSAEDHKYRLYPAKCWRINRKAHAVYDWQGCFAKEQKVYYSLTASDRVKELSSTSFDGAASGTLLSPGSAPRSPQSVYLIKNPKPGKRLGIISDAEIQRCRAHYTFLQEKIGNDPKKAGELAYWKLPVLEKGSSEDSEPWYVFYSKRDDGTYAINRIKMNNKARLGVLIQQKATNQYILFEIYSISLNRNKPEVRSWKKCYGRTVPVFCNVEGKYHSIIDAKNQKLSPRGYQSAVLFCPDKELASNPHYLFEAFDADQTEFYTVANRSIQNYLTDFELRKNTLSGTERNLTPSYWQLPMVPNRPWPVFYRTLSVNESEIEIDFGRSAYLRVRFKHSLGDGIYQAHLDAAKTLTLDYPYSILGFTWKESDDKNQNKAYKSRVSFGDFKTKGNPETEKVSVILGGPKPTSFADYAEKGTDYNEDEFKIRGIKQYWLKKEQKPEIPDGKDKVKDELCVVPKGTVFSGAIRFNNLYPDELGLLLWSLRLDEGCYQTIGKGKPLGYGRSKVTILSVEQDNPAMLYSTDALNADAKLFDTLNADELIQSYQSYAPLNEFLRGKPEDQPSVKDMMYIHSVIREAEEVRYITLDEYRTRARSEVLPTIAEHRQATEDEAKKNAEKEAFRRKEEETIASGSLEDLFALYGGGSNIIVSSKRKEQASKKSKKKKKR